MGLEAVTVDFSQEIFPGVRCRAGVEPPRGSLRISVPLDVNIQVTSLTTLESHNGRFLSRCSGPVVSEATIALRKDTLRSRVKVRVEQGLALMAVLCHRARLAPVDKDIVVWQDLQATLRVRRQAIWCVVRLDRFRGAVGVVQLIDAPPRECVRLLGRRVGSIIKQGDDVYLSICGTGAKSRVVLVAKHVFAGQRK